MSPSQKAKRYARTVVEEKIPAGLYVRLACQRFLDDLKRKDWNYRFDEERADRIVNFMELLPHIKGKWAAKRELLKLQPWQCFIECNLFGWVDKRTGLRRFRECYEEEPRKNGKSSRLAGRGLYLFCADGESGAEVYSGATTEKQAHEIFRPAWMMAQRSRGLCDRFGIDLAGNAKNPGTMFVMEDMSRFETLIGKPGDGASPHAALIDEYHEHDSDQMVSAMNTGMGAREQPLLSIITTAGTNLGSSCFEKRKELTRILDKSAIDETIFGIIYHLDEGDAWDNPENLIKANPNYNISVFGEFLEAQLRAARRSASVQNAFRTKHLNEWVGAKTAWMNMLAWHRQEKPLRMEDFRGCPCFIAADLSSKKDVTAVNATFLRDQKFYSFSKFFVPESAVEENDKYREFVTAGCLEVTDGSMIDHARIEDYIAELNTLASVVDNAFDEWQADYLMVRLMEKKMKVVKFPFNTRNISEPMKQMEALILSGRYFHDGNPMMTWMMGNVAAKLDIRGNIFPNKERPNDPRCKIDGPAAALMALGRALAVPAPEKKYQMIIL